MNLDLSVASLVRASSGALMAAFGLYLLTIRPATPRSRALGAYHLAIGPVFVATNVFSRDLTALALAFRASSPLFLAAAGAVVYLAWVETRRARAARVAFVALFAPLLVASLAAAFLVPSQLVGSFVPAGTADEAAALNRAYDAGRFWYAPANAAWPAAILALALVFRATSGPLARRRVALLAAGLAVYPLFDKASNILLEPSARAEGWIALPAFALAALAWAAVARGPAAAAARNASLVIALAGVAGIGLAVVGNDYGLVGASRLAGLAILAYAIFRHDLLGTDFQATTVRRGTLATGGLAALFIVAQVAQEFLAAEYGLLMGGVVAGAFLFAARPIERALAGAGPPAEASLRAEPRAASDARAQEAYRRAVRLALADGDLTPAEEVALAEIADDLGIGAAEAVRLRQGVQAEAPPGRR